MYENKMNPTLIDKIINKIESQSIERKTQSLQRVGNAIFRTK